jgi:DNA-directed RNA polymerase specialized sigma24 family protein
MRRQLIDCARKRHRADFVEFDEHANRGRFDAMGLDLAIAVNRLLVELAKIRPDWCKLVKLRYFTGLPEQEAAATWA